MAKRSWLLPLGLGATAIALLSFGMKKRALERVSIKGGSLKLDKSQTNITQAVFILTLQVYNPNSTNIQFEYFQAFVSRAGSRLGEFLFNGQGKNMVLKPRDITPVPFTIRFSNFGLVSNIVEIIKQLLNGGGLVSLVLDIDGILTAGGLDVPVKASFDMRTQQLVQNSN